MAHHDRPPEGLEATLFTYKPASEFDEHWVAIDLPVARSIGRKLLAAFQSTYEAPWLELP